MKGWGSRCCRIGSESSLLLRCQTIVSYFLDRTLRKQKNSNALTRRNNSCVDSFLKGGGGNNCHRLIDGP